MNEETLIDKLRLRECKNCGRLYQNIDDSGCIHDLKIVSSSNEDVGGEKKKHTFDYKCFACDQEFEHSYIKTSRHWGSRLVEESKTHFKKEKCPIRKHLSSDN